VPAESTNLVAEFLGQALGVVAGTVLGAWASVFWVDRRIKQEEYLKNRNVRCFAYARTYEVASGLLLRLVPPDVFVGHPHVVEFSGVHARDTGYELTDLLDVDSVVRLNDLLSTEFSGVDSQLRDVLLGYLTELDAIVIAFGRLEESDELADMVALTRALSAFLRSSSVTIARSGIHVPRSASERASYLALVIRCVRLRNGLRASVVSVQPFHLDPNANP
jgi:hypothetical protein